jgi:hypothetical protein
VQQIGDIVQRVKSKAALGRPTILLGYLTTHKTSALFNALMEAGLQDSVPDSGAGDRYCLYHLYMGLKASKLQVIRNSYSLLYLFVCFFVLFCFVLFSIVYLEMCMVVLISRECKAMVFLTLNCSLLDMPSSDKFRTMSVRN